MWDGRVQRAKCVTEDHIPALTTPIKPHQHGGSAPPPNVELDACVCCSEYTKHREA
jgi:hypothetical protein